MESDRICDRDNEFARDRLGEEAFCDDVEHFIDDIHAELALILFLQIVVAHREQRRRDELPATFFDACSRQKVAGDLFANEAIERHVAVE